MFNFWIFLLGGVLAWFAYILIGIGTGVYCEFTLNNVARENLLRKIVEIQRGIEDAKNQEELINFIKICEYPLKPSIPNSMLERFNGYLWWFGVEISGVYSVEFANSIKSYIDVEDKEFSRDKEYLLSIVRRASELASEKAGWKILLKKALTFSKLV